MSRVIEVFTVFLKLGLVAFGGPAAHIALFEQELVNRRAWIDREQLLDLVAMTNLVPGPNSTEVAIHLGYLRAGWFGLLAGGIAFILPSALLTGLLGWIYVAYGSLPQLEPMLAGIKPVVLVIIAAALIKFTKKSVKDWRLGLVYGAVAVMAIAGVHIVIALVAGGLAHVLMKSMQGRMDRSSVFALLPLLTVAAPSVVPSSLWAIFGSFAKIGALLFGSGYVLVAFVQAEIVDAQGWITSAQLMDAIAAGQATPGPILCSATFIGYLIAGLPGAVVATIGIFLPSFFFVSILGPLVPRLKRSKAFAHFLAGAVAGSVGLIGYALVLLARGSLIDLPAFIILALAGGILWWKPKTNTLWLVLGGAALGTLLAQVF